MSIKLQTNHRTWIGATGIGLGVSALTAIIMVTLLKTGISPFPKPPSLAFAETVLGHELPLPVGLLFHTAYVTFWSVVFIQFFSNRGFWPSMMLAGGLWIVVLIVFFPLIGWGVAGLHVSPKLIPASFLPHLLFGFFLWALEQNIPRRSPINGQG